MKNLHDGCQGILGKYCLRWLGEFLWTRTIFNPPHMWDLMDDVDDTYKQSNLMLNDAINLNEDPMDATKVMQDFNVEQGTNVLMHGCLNRYFLHIFQPWK